MEITQIKKRALMGFSIYVSKSDQILLRNCCSWPHHLCETVTQVANHSRTITVLKCFSYFHVCVFEYADGIRYPIYINKAFKTSLGCGIGNVGEALVEVLLQIS